MVERKLKFMDFLGTLIGKKFHMPRGYGHAEFEIVEYSDRDTVGTLVDLSTNKAILCNHGGPAVVRGPIIKRLGGYNGKPELATLQELLEKFE